MGTDSGEDVERLPNPHSFKVHSKMCIELMKLVDRISSIFPDIETARPGCSSGIQALCLLNNAIDKAKLLLQHCSECSNLYLAVTGDTVLSRCQKTRISLKQSLIQIQGMLPVLLAAAVSGIIDDLDCAKFVLDSAEEEAGRVVRELLQQGNSASDSVDNSEVQALKFAAPRLNITSPKAILIEKRSIKKLLDKIGPNDPKKKMILRYLLYLLKKHGNLILEEQTEKAYSPNEEPIATDNSSHDSLQRHHVESESLDYGQCRTQTSELGTVTPPEEYKCPISSRLMYDPIVIASGLTYERIWIQKWFDEGNDICPKTKEKLAHMGLTPNIIMKELISKWCRNNGVSLPDPSRQAENFHSWETSSTSIKSLGSYYNDLNLPMDHSFMSLGSLDASYSSDVWHAKITHGSNLIKNSDNSHKDRADAAIQDTDLMLLSELHDLQWDSQCKVIEDLKDHVKINHQAFSSVSPEDFIKPLVKFLNNAYDQHEVKALRAGTELLLELVNNCRNGLTNLSEDVFSMLTSFLDSEVIGEALAIMEELSGYWSSKARIAASSALTSILNVLDSDDKEFQQRAIRIMYNLSFNGEVCHHFLSLKCIPKLLPFFIDRSLLRYCICILKNLCDTDEGRNSVAETKGCISSVTEILETGSNEEQEHALVVLVSLCSQRVDYCKLVMDRDIILPLAYISKNGNDKGKAAAMELLRLLRDVDYVENEDCLEPNLNTPQESNNHPPQEKKTSKGTSFMKKLSLFSKSSSHASKSKR
ncbi:unnamed protein product [Lupinus luteus]|uniref:RING-type E3 ubiquitin transferase n=1 Tax=Lupinus luteus TaxID=3873 RepID=A0AAV1YFR1_LUPLU